MKDLSLKVNNLLTVIVVNYNSSASTTKLLDSLKYIDKIVQEVIVIDNGSIDLNKLVISNNAKLIKNSTNLGFSKAVNQGINKSNSEYILLLNPDTFLTDNSIKDMYHFFIKHKKIGAIGGKMYSGKNNFFTANSKPTIMTGLFEFTNLKKVFPNNVFTSTFWIENHHKTLKPIKVHSICGGFLMFKKYLNNKLQLFDENIFLYLEDLDFCINVNKENYEVWFYPKSSIQHIGGQSSNSKYKIVLKHWYKSRKYFFNKHFPVIGFFLEIIFTLEESLLRLYHYLKNEPNE